MDLLITVVQAARTIGQGTHWLKCWEDTFPEPELGVSGLPLGDKQEEGEQAEDL